MVVLLICLVLVVVAIVVVIRLLLAELARSAAYRHSVPRDSGLGYATAVNPAGAKAPVSAARAAARPPGAMGGAAGGAVLYDEPEIRHEGGLLVESGPRPRQREVGKVTKVVWWRRLRSGTALMVLVGVLGVATAALIGAIVLFFAFVLEQAIN